MPAGDPSAGSNSQGWITWSHPSHLAFQRGSLRERAAPDQPSSAMLERKSSSKGWENDDENDIVIGRGIMEVDVIDVMLGM